MPPPLGAKTYRQVDGPAVVQDGNQVSCTHDVRYKIRTWEVRPLPLEDHVVDDSHVVQAIPARDTGTHSTAW